MSKTHLIAVPLLAAALAGCGNNAPAPRYESIGQIDPCAVLHDDDIAPLTTGAMRTEKKRDGAGCSYRATVSGSSQGGGITLQLSPLRQEAVAWSGASAPYLAEGREVYLWPQRAAGCRAIIRYHDAVARVEIAVDEGKRAPSLGDSESPANCEARKPLLSRIAKRIVLP